MDLVLCVTWQQTRCLPPRLCSLRFPQAVPPAGLPLSVAAGELSIPDPSLRILSSAVVPETLANCSHRTDSAHSQIIVEGSVARCGSPHLRTNRTSANSLRAHRPLYGTSKPVARRLPVPLSPSTRERLQHTDTPSNGAILRSKKTQWKAAQISYGRSVDQVDT
jgi:hypothetical protein